MRWKGKLLLSIFIFTSILCNRQQEKQENKKIKIWGTAISGFQADMGPGVPPDTKSDWWVWMHDEENQISKRVGEDKPEDGPAFWKNYKEDLELAKQIGTNYFRYSIEWSRVFPGIYKRYSG